MIDFATLTSIECGGKFVSQIEDSSGRVLWAVQSNEPIVLEVEKIIQDTYAGETTYKGEQFILLDIYPKTNGTVKVTYGGLTKTITDTSGAEEPNAQKVFFGTFNGVSDSVETPASGELVIDGYYYAVGVSVFSYGKSTNTYCNCVTKIINFGNMKDIPESAFRSCKVIPYLELPSDITSIGGKAFFGCEGLQSITLLGTNPPTVADDSFPTGDGYEILIPIIVPKGCGEAYKAAEGWSGYAGVIVEAS